MSFRQTSAERNAAFILFFPTVRWQMNCIHRSTAELHVTRRKSNQKRERDAIGISLVGFVLKKEVVAVAQDRRSNLSAIESGSLEKKVTRPTNRKSIFAIVVNVYNSRLRVICVSIPSC